MWFFNAKNQIFFAFTFRKGGGIAAAGGNRKQKGIKKMLKKRNVI